MDRFRGRYQGRFLAPLQTSLYHRDRDVCEVRETRLQQVEASVLQVPSFHYKPHQPTSLLYQDIRLKRSCDIPSPLPVFDGTVLGGKDRQREPHGAPLYLHKLVRFRDR